MRPSWTADVVFMEKPSTLTISAWVAKRPKEPATFMARGELRFGRGASMDAKVVSWGRLDKAIDYAQAVPAIKDLAPLIGSACEMNNEAHLAVVRDLKLPLERS